VHPAATCALQFEMSSFNPALDACMCSQAWERLLHAARQITAREFLTQHHPKLNSGQEGHTCGIYEGVNLGEDDVVQIGTFTIQLRLLPHPVANVVNIRVTCTQSPVSITFMRCNIPGARVSNLDKRLSMRASELLIRIEFKAADALRRGYTIGIISEAPGKTCSYHCAHKYSRCVAALIGFLATGASASIDPSNT
jgi:hypothetical protein